MKLLVLLAAVLSLSACGRSVGPSSQVGIATPHASVLQTPTGTVAITPAQECDQHPVPTEAKFVRYRGTLGPRQIEFDMPDDWELTAIRSEGQTRNYRLYFSRPQRCREALADHFVPNATEVLFTDETEIQRLEKIRSASQWKQEQANIYGNRQTVLEEDEIQISGTPGLMIVRKLAANPTYPTSYSYARFTFFDALVNVGDRFYELEMRSPDEIVNNSREIYDQILSTLNITDQ